jgi:cell division FtsZ-interacting protein ZapD
MSDDPVLVALGRLERERTRLRTDMLGQMSRVLDEQTRVRTDLMARMDRHEIKLDAIHDDFGVNMGAVEAVRRSNQNTREQVNTLSEMVASLHRELRTRVDDLEAKGG